MKRNRKVTGGRLPVVLASACGAVILFLVFVLPFDSGIVVPGRLHGISNEQEIRTVYGGRVLLNPVVRGQVVQAGTPLLTLDARSFAQELDSLVVELDEMEARAAGLRASLLHRYDRFAAGSDGTDPAVEDQPPAPPLDLADLEETVHARQVSAVRTALRTRTEVLEERVDATYDRLRNLAEIRGLIAKERHDIDALFRKGLERASRLYALDRAHFEVLARVSEAERVAAEAAREAASLQAQSLADQLQDLRHSVDQYWRVRAMASDMRRRVLELERRVDDAAMVAAFDGIVVDWSNLSDGSVLEPGLYIGRISKLRPDWQIVARVKVDDVPHFAPGAPVQVRFLAVSRRGSHPALGRVLKVLPQALADEATREPYFPVLIEIDTSGLPAETRDHLLPDMTVEVLAKGRNQMLFEYVLHPVLFSLGWM